MRTFVSGLNPTRTMTVMQVTLVYFDGCPSWELAHERLVALAPELGYELTLRRVETADEAEQVGFRGSPTILRDGRDPFAEGTEPVGLSCRIYQTTDGPSGAPTLAQLRVALT
jgi:hypothetical protein